LQVDKEVDQPYTISVIQLEKDTREAKNKQLVLDFWRYFSQGAAPDRRLIFIANLHIARTRF